MVKKKNSKRKKKSEQTAAVPRVAQPVPLWRVAFPRIQMEYVVIHPRAAPLNKSHSWVWQEGDHTAVPVVCFPLQKGNLHPSFN